MTENARQSSGVAEAIIGRLFERGCLQLSVREPFTYASGLKGPVYCDNRRLLSFPQDRNLVVEAFVELMRKKGWERHTVAGMATAGIPHAALIADRLNAPMIYVRSKPKGHGKGNQVEGVAPEGVPVVLIEDLVNQGKSLLEGVDGLRKAEISMAGALSIVSYDMPAAKERFEEKGIECHSLAHFSEILSYGIKHQLISKEESRILEDWQRDPQSWEKKYCS